MYSLAQWPVGTSPKTGAGVGVGVGPGGAVTVVHITIGAHPPAEAHALAGVRVAKAGSNGAVVAPPFFKERSRVEPGDPAIGAVLEPATVEVGILKAKRMPIAEIGL